MLISWDIKWSKSWMPHRRSIRNFRHWAWAIWDLSNHDLFWIIPDPGSQKRITLSLEFISTVPFRTRASNVWIPRCGQHCSNRGRLCLVSIFGIFPINEDQPNKNPGAWFRCTADIFSNSTNREIQWPGMLVAREICTVGLVGCTNDWHNCRSSRKLILRITPPILCIHLAVYLVTYRVCKAYGFKIEVHLKWEMCTNNLHPFESIPVV